MTKQLLPESHSSIWTNKSITEVTSTDIVPNSSHAQQKPYPPAA